MPGKGVSRILDSVDSFHHRFGQIPYLSRYGKASSQPNQRENGLREVREKKKRKRMKVSGRKVFDLKKIIEKK